MPRYDSILDTIGNTPLVRLNKLAPPGVNVFAKVESFNPLGSVKDRMARAIIEDAEMRGDLQPGQTVVEATSGNTGIGMALAGAALGYKVLITMPEKMSQEKHLFYEPYRNLILPNRCHLSVYENFHENVFMNLKAMNQ